MESVRAGRRSGMTLLEVLLVAGAVALTALAVSGRSVVLYALRRDAAEAQALLEAARHEAVRKEALVVVRSLPGRLEACLDENASLACEAGEALLFARSLPVEGGALLAFNALGQPLRAGGLVLERAGSQVTVCLSPGGALEQRPGGGGCG